MVNVVNAGVTQGELIAAGLSAQLAIDVTAHRNGNDGLTDTTDDQLFGSIEDIAALPGFDSAAVAVLAALVADDCLAAPELAPVDGANDDIFAVAPTTNDVAALVPTATEQSRLAAPFAGVRRITGSDARGHYTGRVELLAKADGTYGFTRVISYDATVLVEDNRRLAWVWQGIAKPVAGGLQISVALQKADFVSKRGRLARTDEDKKPVRVAGTFQVTANGLAGSFSGIDLAATESWDFATPSTAGKPIFARAVTEVATHTPAGTLFSWLAEQFTTTDSAQFAQTPAVKPYAASPLFARGVHTSIDDKTDFAFYRAHPAFLRVVNKVIDPISLQETVARADAFRSTLVQKAAYFDAEAETKAVDPKTGMVYAYYRPDGVGTPNHDGALWTGAYIASQAYRYRVTKSPKALANIERSTQGILSLLEITGDRKVFARTLRPATGHAVAPWHAGTGRFANLEWKEGGNNDMFKGVMLGMYYGYSTLCATSSSNVTLCNRLRANSRLVADQLAEAQAGGNELMANWVAATLTGDDKYHDELTVDWAQEVPELNMGKTAIFANGVADWSGAHLAFVSYMMFTELLAVHPPTNVLLVSPRTVLHNGVDDIYENFALTRPGLWSVGFASLGSVRRADAATAAAWRLREVPAPKTQMLVDHRVNGNFMMSPYPFLPWKRDWQTTDRTQSLRSYPLFETGALSDYAWKENAFAYKGGSPSVRYPGVDYLIAYWLGRANGVISATH